MGDKKKSVTGDAVHFGLLKKVFTYTTAYKKYFYIAAACAIVLAFLSIVRPLLIQYAIDKYVMVANEKMLLVLVLFMTGALLIEVILQFFESYVSSMLGQFAIKDLRVSLYKRVVNLRLKFYDNTPIGVLVTRIVSDMETIADIFSQGFFTIIGDILKLSTIVVLMFVMNVKLALASLATIPLLLVFTYFFKNAVKAAFQDVRTQVAKLNAFVQEHITGMNIVQVFGREKVELEKFKEINSKHRNANIRSVWHYSLFFPAVEILSSISIALLIWIAGKEVLKGQATLGQISAFIFFINMVFRPIRQLADNFNTLQMGMVGSERVFNLLETTEDIIDNGVLKADDIKGKVEFKNVWFAYNNEDWVLKNISFHVQPGQTVALVGATGAGKSSIVNLINRFYEYNKGEILVDDVNVRDYNLLSLRTHTGLVLQDVFLFSDTIANNISLNDPKITRAQIIEASKAVGAHEFIMRLPDNYDYNVMERGAMLSVGQRQLIAFIRAYVFDPAILILDEATSSIDTESEILIQKAIDKLTVNRTSIIVAHRLATIQKADIILVFEKGEIVERGSHQQLLAQNGYYKRLFDLQFKEQNRQVA